MLYIIGGIAALVVTVAVLIGKYLSLDAGSDWEKYDE